MKKYKYIFIVLVYKNTADLIDFFAHLDIEDSHVLVVNSYYDDATEEQFKKIAVENNADFLSVENRGYGAGNNAGIDYALKNYEFDYLIISNADICVESMEVTPSPNVITAPKIVTKSGKNQNPHIPYYIKALEIYKYMSFTRLGRKYLIFPIAINKLFRFLFRTLYNMGFKKYIYAPHGSFIIFPKSIIELLHPIFDEKIFLFAEEDVLAFKAKNAKIKVEYCPKIIIKHKEDGSVSSISDKAYEILKESNIYYFNNYIKKLK